jgi:hypothetical protein
MTATGWACQFPRAQRMAGIHPLRTLNGPRLPLTIEEPTSAIPDTLDEDQFYIDVPL